MKINYHTHTTRCHHAQGTDRAYVESAIAAGIEELGFSDHVPQPYPDGFVSPCRMSMDELEAYVTSITSLKKEYQKDITIHLGFEAEYFPTLFPALMAHLKPYPVEYLLMGQHYLGSEADGPYTGAPCGSDILKWYAQTLIEGLRTGNFLYVAHPDVVRYQGPDEVFFQSMRPVFEELKKLHKPVEYNMLGHLEHRHYPSQRMLQLASQVGNEIIIGYDAHFPEMFAREDQISEAIRTIEGYGLTIVNDPLVLPDLKFDFK